MWRDTAAGNSRALHCLEDTMMPNATLLIVNHDREINLLMQKLLRSGGYQTEAVESIAEALLRLRVQKPALLLCRNAMNVGNGPDFINYAWWHFQVPGILMTGTLTRKQVAARVVPDALRGVLIIPFGAAELQSSVVAALAPADVAGQSLGSDERPANQQLD